MRLQMLATIGLFVLGGIVGAAMVSIGYRAHEPQPAPHPPEIANDAKPRRPSDAQLLRLREMQMARLRKLQKAVPPQHGTAADGTFAALPGQTWRDVAETHDTATAVAVNDTPERRVELVAMPVEKRTSPPTAEVVGNEVMDTGAVPTLLAVVEDDTAEVVHFGPEATLAPETEDVAVAVVDTTADEPVPTVDELIDGGSDMEKQVLQAAMAQHTRDEALPSYELLHATKDFNSDKVYAEVLIPSLKPDTQHDIKQRVVDAIAQREGLDIVTVYSTMEARMAHYSMEYYDANPGALAVGYVGEYEKGRLWAFVPEDGK